MDFQKNPAKNRIKKLDSLDFFTGNTAEGLAAVGAGRG
jgi:hypothetical protein